MRSFALSPTLYLLVNHTAPVTGGIKRMAEGSELQFATNHLGHFALAIRSTPARPYVE